MNIIIIIPVNFMLQYRVLYFMFDDFMADFYNDKNLTSFEKISIYLTIFKDLAYEMKSLFLYKPEYNEV